MCGIDGRGEKDEKSEAKMLSRDCKKKKKKQNQAFFFLLFVRFLQLFFLILFYFSLASILWSMDHG